MEKIFYGLCNLPWWGNLVVLLVTTQLTILSVTIFLHRHQAHRALDLHPAVSHLFRFWLWLATGMLTKEWAAIHRKHHARCETAGDPHSPQVLGLDTVLWTGAELYRKEAKNQETLDRYGQGTPDDWVERNVYSKYSKLGILSFLGLELFLFGVPGLALWAVQMAWIPFWAAGVVNGIGHFWGYRNFECKDQARNISPIGFWIGGEELHNNHHTFPTSAKFSAKWWEFDIGWGIIRILSFFRLAKVKRAIPRACFAPEKDQIDTETIKALIANRFQITASYSKNVILPIWKQESENLKSVKEQMVGKLKELLVREPSLLAPLAQERLKTLLSENQKLSLVYEFRQRLQGIWGQTQAKEKELIQALQEWCKEAEATGIKALEEFSIYIKSLCLV